ncbi:LysR family transcriptional regulator [Ignatzschineria sp. RMDPL8A]|uniref:LysR family transcriptional regulator n=1 Tax=Ignatzschineria sp. RMDPL8A TaxID=2999236 RepID=UPI00244673F7|nr:LysR family transcriptional regulator [Ignatzschineria sp. RMDPL8A]MDG9728847.1 LysR family transcriptional regulator [Ignatzschineria sp. RMDPL8A]
MTLRHLEIFYAVMVCGSLTRAAQMLHISQPAASKALKHAELRIGFKLFDRSRGKLLPTKEAYILFEKAQIIYRDLSDLKELAENLLNHPEGRLSIGCLPSLGLSLIPKVTSLFMRHHTAINVEISTHHTADLLNLLSRYDLDFAISFTPLEEAGIASIPLMTIPLVYLDAIRQPTPVKIESIDLSRWIHPGVDSLGQRIKEHRSFHSSRLNVQTYYMAAAFVKQNMGCTISDIFSATETLPETMIHPISPKIELDICLLHRSDMPLSKAAQDYQLILQEYLNHIVPILNQTLYGNDKNSIV